MPSGRPPQLECRLSHQPVFCQLLPISALSGGARPAAYPPGRTDDGGTCGDDPTRRSRGGLCSCPPDAILSAIIQTGATVALISDDSLAPRSDVDWHVQCITLVPGPLLFHISVMLVIQLLATRLIEVSGAEGRKRLSSIDALHDRLDES